MMMGPTEGLLETSHLQDFGNIVKKNNKKTSCIRQIFKKNEFYPKLEKIPPFSKNKKKYTASFFLFCFKVIDAIKYSAVPVVFGDVSTILGLLPVAWSQSTISRNFFSSRFALA